MNTCTSNQQKVKTQGARLEQLKKRRRHIYTVFKAKEFVSPDKKWGTYAQADDHSKRGRNPENQISKQ